MRLRVGIDSLPLRDAPAMERFTFFRGSDSRFFSVKLGDGKQICKTMKKGLVGGRVIDSFHAPPPNGTATAATLVEAGDEKVEENSKFELTAETESLSCPSRNENGVRR